MAAPRAIGNIGVPSARSPPVWVGSVHVAVPPPAGSARHGTSPRARRDAQLPAVPVATPTWNAFREVLAATAIEAAQLREPSSKPRRGGSEAWRGGSSIILPHLNKNQGRFLTDARFANDTESFGQRRRVNMNQMLPRRVKRRRRLKPEEVAVQRIQATWRVRAARRERQRLLEEQRGALHVIRKHVMPSVLPKRVAAEAVQRCARQYIGRRLIERKLREDLVSSLDGLNALNHDLDERLDGLMRISATTVQSSARGLLARSQRRRAEQVMHRFKENYASTRLQHAWAAQLEHRRQEEQKRLSLLQRSSEPASPEPAGKASPEPEDDKGARCRMHPQKKAVGRLPDIRPQRCTCEHGMYCRACQTGRGCGRAQMWELQGPQGFAALY